MPIGYSSTFYPCLRQRTGARALPTVPFGTLIQQWFDSSYDTFDHEEIVRARRYELPGTPSQGLSIVYSSRTCGGLTAFCAVRTTSILIDRTICISHGSKYERQTSPMCLLTTRESGEALHPANLVTSSHQGTLD